MMPTKMESTTATNTSAWATIATTAKIAVSGEQRHAPTVSGARCLFTGRWIAVKMAMAAPTLYPTSSPNRVGRARANSSSDVMYDAEPDRSELSLIEKRLVELRSNISDRGQEIDTD